MTLFVTVWWPARPDPTEIFLFHYHAVTQSVLQPVDYYRVQYMDKRARDASGTSRLGQAHVGHDNGRPGMGRLADKPRT